MTFEFLGPWLLLNLFLIFAIPFTSWTDTQENPREQWGIRPAIVSLLLTGSCLVGGVMLIAAATSGEAVSSSFAHLPLSLLPILAGVASILAAFLVVPKWADRWTRPVIPAPKPKSPNS